MIAESFILDNKSNEESPTPISIPTDLKSRLEVINKKIDEKKNEKPNILTRQIRAIDEELNEPLENLDDLQKKISEIKERLKTRIEESEIERLSSDLKQTLKRKKEVLSQQSTKSDPKMEKSLKIVKKINNILIVSEAGVDIYNKYRNDQSNLNAIAKSISNTETKMNELRQYEDNIYQSIIPMIKKIWSDINKADGAGKSHAALDISKWMVQNSIRNLKSHLQQVVKGYEVQEDLIRCMEKLDESITTSINLYDRIQNYQDQERLAQYISNIRSPNADLKNIKNNALREAIASLKEIIQYNIVLGQYNNAMQAFKQWVFPFAPFYQEDCQLPKSPLLPNNTLQTIKEDVIKQIKNISSRVKEYYTSIEKYDVVVKEGEFYNSKSMNPFMIWANKTYQKEIANLFEGKVVTLKADIRKSDSEKSAIKFNKIDIFFRTDPILQTELEKKLASFEVILTHLGNSYYRWNNQHIVIVGRERVISYHYEKRENGEPVSSNLVYQKIAKGDLMLSPYTMWNIHLKAINGKGSNYGTLQNYKGKVDLELVGHGKWIDESKPLSELSTFNV
ncbi:Macrophage receptor MARCO [Gigaspora margarita]|uniref:Macrophage receptor MARCO n=1 Tax=Gigaspora margarita TaxID=4874 RepID=A0A8H4EPM1_GIGMA|nr:Macrophage receptor MARCO [Gigaspora margarita]